MRVAIIADSHIPEREESIPEQFCDLIADAPHTVHAGDFETPSALADVRALANDLTAVHGNIDPAGIGLPTVAELSVEGITFVVTHGTANRVQNAVHEEQMMVGDPGEWRQAVADTARARTRNWDGDGVVGVGGHIHQVKDEVVDGLRVLNPGSVTGAPPAERATMLTADVDGKDVDVSIHEV